MKTPSDSALADAQAIITDLRRQLAERTAERDEAVAQQTATAEVLGVINASPGDLAPVFDAILEKAHSLCDAAHGSLFLADGEHFRPAAMRGVPERFAERLRLGFRASDAIASAPLLRGAPFVHLIDMAQIDHPMARAAVELAGARTLLSVPLRKGDAVLGIIVAVRFEVRPFSDKQIALLQNFAAQAVIAMENARLLTETREALEQQTATAEVLQVINSSPGDLAPVFDAILERAHLLCEAEKGALVTYDGAIFRAAATRRLSEQYAALLREPQDNPEGSPPWRLLQGDSLVQIEDFRTIDLPIPRTAADLEGARTVLFIPLRKDAALLGYITVYRQEVRLFSDKQIALLQNFAAQAVIAMENARLITETHEALEQQTATAEVLGVINASPGNLAPVFEAMLDKATNLCEAAHGHLWTYDGELFQPVAAHGNPEFSEWVRERGAVPAGPGTPFERVVDGEHFIHVTDIEKDNGCQHPGFRQLIEVSGTRTHLVVPLRREAALLGVIAIYREEVRAFTDKQIALLQNFAAQAVIAMENARLIIETHEALEQQTATAEVLQVINMSPGDLAPVFDAMLEKAVRLCEASLGTLSKIEDDNFYAVAVHGAPAEFAAAIRQPRKMAPGNAHYRLAQGADIVHIEDVSADDIYHSGNAARSLLVDVAGARTTLWVALRKDEKALGAFVVYRREVRPFTDKQIALLRNFAAQAVIAMENVRLITETREALERQTATAEVLGVINSSPGELAPVFDAMLEKAIRLCEGIQGTLWTFAGEQILFAASRGLTPEFVDLLRDTRERNDPGEQDPVKRVMRGERLVQVLDIAAEHSHGPVFRAAAQFGGVGTIMAVGLFKEAMPLGAFVISRRDVRSFTDKQVALLQNFAAQAVIAMENARLLTETREALEQQTATAEVLQVINSSPGDLAPVFDAMLEKAHRLCGAEMGSLQLYDGESFRAVAARGMSEEYADHLRRGRPASVGESARLITGGRFVQVMDMAESGSAATAAARAGIRTVLFVPLRKDGNLLGLIAAGRREIRAFSDKQIALLENFAAQAVIAMENARLITETREALEQQTATAEVLGVINSSPGDLAPVFDAIVEKAHTLCDAAHGSLTLAEGPHFRAVAMRGMPEEFAEVLRHPFHSGRFVEQLSDGAPFVQLADLTNTAVSTDNRVLRAAVGLGGVRTLLGVPLRKDGTLLGYITANRREVRPFTDKQIALLQNFAAQAVIAIENARLLGELRQRTEEVAELNRGLEARVAEQVDELGRVGRLKRFLAPQLAELIVSQGDEKILESHRREIVVVFCDLRGYTAFTETAEPEEVLDFLREYHGALGPLVSQFEGTLEQFSGDGIMVFFNDPVPIPDPAERAVNMAVAMREAAGTLIVGWRERGRELGFGAGIAQGYATLGQIGFSERSGYTAIGTVCNVAACLCAEAKDGQILLSQRVNVALKGSVATEQLGALSLKGLTQPVVAYNVPLAAIQPALRVIEGGPQSV